MADCMTIEDIRHAYELGSDLVSTTLSHNKPAIETSLNEGPDLPLLRQAVEEFPDLPSSARDMCIRRKMPALPSTLAPGPWWLGRLSHILRVLRVGLRRLLTSRVVMASLSFCCVLYASCRKSTP